MSPVVRILSIETSTARGSVALVEGEQLVAALEHRRENAHGESILPLVEQALAQAGWSRGQLDRIAVGIGPGSFTGLRVGIAVAQGLSEGLEVPLVGVPSLQAMALATPGEQTAPRCVLTDARKNELFAAVYDAHGCELLGVRLLANPEDLLCLTRELSDPLFIGNGVALWPGLSNVYRSADTDYPHARWTARAALGATPSALVHPLYVRDAVAVIPKLPENPLRPPPEPASGS
jgi:tRNA threonylcarbamoyladenosine biosynthesis protein TsaB